MARNEASSTDIPFKHEHQQIVARLEIRRREQCKFALAAVDQCQPECAARYGDIADAYKVAIDMLNEMMANAEAESSAGSDD